MDSAMANEAVIVELPGAYVNANEPEPAWNRKPIIFGIVITFIVLKWIAVLFRIFTRWRVTFSLGWDDLFVMLVLLSGTIGSIFVLMMAEYGGLGRHFWAISQDELVNYLLYYYVSSATYNMSTAFIKISLLFQYIRIFSDEPRIRTICKWLIVFTAMWAAAYSSIALVPCYPISRFWSWSERRFCWGFASPNGPVIFGAYASHAGINMILDIFILLVPLPLYWRQKTQWNTKVGLLALHTVGAIICFVSAWRLFSVVEHRAATYPAMDPTWYAPISLLLTVVEVHLGGICASIPVFWPVLTARLSRIFVTHEITIETEECRKYDTQTFMGGRTKRNMTYYYDPYGTDWDDPFGKKNWMVEIVAEKPETKKSRMV